MSLIPCQFLSQCGLCVSLQYCIFILSSVNNNASNWRCQTKLEHQIPRTPIAIDDPKYCYRATANNGQGQVIDHDGQGDNLIPVWPTHDEIHTREKILVNYDANVTPWDISGQPTNLHLKLNVVNFKLDTTSFSLLGILHAEWIDTRLAWSKFTDDPNLVKSRLDLFMPNNSVWTPHVAPGNKSTELKTGEGRHLVPVDPDGRVTRDYPLGFTSSCMQDLLLWPFDAHTCEIALSFNSSRTSSESSVSENPEREPSRKTEFDTVTVADAITEDKKYEPNLVLLPLAVNHEQNRYISVKKMVRNPSWSVLSTKVSRIETACLDCLEPFLVFTFKLEREAGLGVKLFVVLPMIFFAALEIFTLVLSPVLYNMKIIVKSFNLLASSVVLVVIGTVLVPHHSGSVPLIIIFFIFNIVMVSLSLAVVLIIYYSTKIKPGKPFPVCLKIVISNSRWFIRILGLENRIPVDPEDSADQAEPVSDDGVEVGGDAIEMAELSAPDTRQGEKLEEPNETGAEEADADREAGGEAEAPADLAVVNVSAEQSTLIDQPYYILVSSITERLFFGVYLIVSLTIAIVFHFMVSISKL